MRAAIALLLLSGCALVLDLDAEPSQENGSGGAGAGGGNGTGGVPVTSDAGAGTPMGGSPPTCVDGALAFDGGQQIVVSRSDSDGPDELDRDDKVAIGAWILPTAASPGGGSEERFILSRTSSSQAKGYALLLNEASDDGALYPELRLFVDGEPCNCVSSAAVAVGDWTHVSGYYAKPRARVFLDGSEVCSRECGNEKLGKFESNTRVGVSSDGQSGFRGLMDHVFVLSPSSTPPPMISQGVCFPGLKLLFTFEQQPEQSFAPTCGVNLGAVLGSSPSVGSDDPIFQGCP